MRLATVYLKHILRARERLLDAIKGKWSNRLWDFVIGGLVVCMGLARSLRVYHRYDCRNVKVDEDMLPRSWS